MRVRRRGHYGGTDMVRRGACGGALEQGATAWELGGVDDAVSGAVACERLWHMKAARGYAA